MFLINYTLEDTDTLNLHMMAGERKLTARMDMEQQQPHHMNMYKLKVVLMPKLEEQITIRFLNYIAREQDQTYIQA